MIVSSQHFVIIRIHVLLLVITGSSESEGHRLMWELEFWASSPRGSILLMALWELWALEL